MKKYKFVSIKRALKLLDSFINGSKNIHRNFYMDFRQNPYNFYEEYRYYFADKEFYMKKDCFIVHTRIPHLLRPEQNIDNMYKLGKFGLFFTSTFGERIFENHIKIPEKHFQF